MPLDQTTFLVLTVIWVATVIRSALGFGEALVAVPLLALFIPVGVAAPLAVLVSITVAGVILLRDWREVHAASASRLVLSSFVGIPFGLLLLTTVADPVVKATLAIIIISFAVFRLVGRSRLELRDDRLAWLFGFGAGVLGGAYGMNGPPLVAYGTLRHWSPERFRATLQGYFLPASLVGMAGYWIAGLWVPAVTRYYLASLPLVLVAIALGRFLTRRMDGERYLLYVHLTLVVIGATLLVQSVWGLALG
ncbi:MAG: sulfite exporter TauE/SafE family protein [Isosphaeraceae bacterium]